MKILQVISSLAPGFGGPTNAALGLSSALVQQGQEVTIFTTNAGVKGKLNVPLETPINIQNVKVLYFPVQWPRHYKFSLLLSNALKKYIPHFDIIHIHSLFQFSTLAASYYCRRYHKPYIIRPLGQLDPFVLRRHRLIKRLYFELFERKNLNGARAIHFTTEQERYLTEDLGLEAKRIVVGLGLDLGEFKTLPESGVFRSTYPEVKDKKIILFLSRINFKKGLDILVKAFAQITKKREDVHLVIAGPDDEGYGRRIKKWLGKEDILNRVTFTGMLLGQDKLAALRDSDIFVLSSYSENFGMVVVEAMACGLPVIISNHVGIHKEVSQSEAGIVIQTNAKQLAEAIENLLDNSHICKKMGENGRQLVDRVFRLDRVADKMIELYEDILRREL